MEESFIYIFTRIIYYILWTFEILMIIRALLSWLPINPDNAISVFCQRITEPVIAPVRAILDHFESTKRLPFDLSFLVTFLILSILQTILSALL